MYKERQTVFYDGNFFSQKFELLIKLQNCINDKFALIILCDFFSLIKDITISKNDFPNEKRYFNRFEKSIILVEPPQNFEHLKTDLKTMFVRNNMSENTIIAFQSRTIDLEIQTYKPNL